MKTRAFLHVFKFAVLVLATFLQISPSTHAEIIANSISEFSGVQGANGWFYGYRSIPAVAHATNYDPVTDFLPFAGGDGAGPWNAASQHWTGSAWDLNTASAAPWTFLAQTNVHPNGLNNTVEHWAIRRWYADELLDITPLAVTWHTRKQSIAGAGVTGGLHVNGVRIDGRSIAGTDGVGVTRTIYINVEPGWLLDLVLTPRGPTGDTADGSDGSFNSLIIDNTIPVGARQPDGTVFIPYGAPDADSDGLPDPWEFAYFPGDLTKLSEFGDFDNDGLYDSEELANNTDPDKADTDNDGLSDSGELAAGTLARVQDTDGDGRKDGDEVNGPIFSNPLVVDTDGDTFSDGEEVSTGHDPGDPLHNRLTTLIANSSVEFSGVQGRFDWYYGYRNVTADGGNLDTYDPVSSFVRFTGGDGFGAWDINNNHWTGTQWDLQTASTAPWTQVGGGDFVHPNGNNNAFVHWATRRWVANELTEERAVAIRHHVRKQGTGGGANGGVTGGLYINGRKSDTIAIASANTTGFTRTYYANLKPGDIVDLILSPRGPTGNDSDGSDGSFHWMHVDVVLPPNPVQPDGTPFVPVNSGDLDLDDLPDAWENLYFPGDLTKLTGAGDFDNDGLNDLGEYERGSNPTVADTDNDGLPDRVETATGTFVDANNTGSNPANADSDADGLGDAAEVNGNPATNPNRADTDGDSFSDPAELAAGTNPNDPADNPLTFVIANSIAEFSGVQGRNGWYNGYRNYTAFGGGDTFYDPSLFFIPYTGGEGQGAWDGIGQQWTGGAWDLNTAAAGPWTFQNATSIHPNGVNSFPGEEHWAIRRWIGDELSDVTPVAIIWQVYKENPAGSGVTGSIHVNGQRIDFLTIGGNASSTAIRRVYANLNPGDIVDLALSPLGLGNDRGDGADGSVTWCFVDTRLPREPRQPDGSLFIPANAEDTDHDGLLDFWERIYAPDLATLTGTGDNDSDGLDNAGEFQRDANPLDGDTDNDGLADGAESNTGIFVNESNTGTKPRVVDTDGDGRSDGDEVHGTPATNPVLADTDGDGYSDGSEIASGHNPNNPNNNPTTTTAADSLREFAGAQGQNSWFHGYYDASIDADQTYQITDFIAFLPEHWNGTGWDINPVPSNPWTELFAEGTHPNGPSPVHWTIRRWAATELTGTTPLALRWHMRKTNPNCGNGVTGAIHVNGQRVDSAVIAFNNTTGITRTYYVNANPDDIVELILNPYGTDNDPNDGCDGSANWIQIDRAIPPNPRQPDGSPFIPANTPPTVVITSPTAGALIAAGSTVTLVAQADDPGGSVERVEFFAQGIPQVGGTGQYPGGGGVPGGGGGSLGTSLGFDDSAPFEVSIVASQVGPFMLTAVATDNLFASTPSAPVMVTVVANAAPSFTPGRNIIVDEDSGPFSIPWASDISPGPAHEASQTVAFQITGVSQPGLFSAGPAIAPDGTLSFTPAPNACGAAQVTVVLHDNGGTDFGGQDTSAPYTLVIFVNCVIDPPFTAPVVAQTDEDIPVGITLLGSDPDPGDSLTYEIVTQPAHGTLKGSGANRIYTPAANYNGPDSFTYRVTDLSGLVSPTSTVTITVHPVDDAPDCQATVSPLAYLGEDNHDLNVIAPDGASASVTFDASLSSDPEGNALTFTWFITGEVLPVAAGAVVTLDLEVGTHILHLVVDDGQSSCTKVLEVHVLSAQDAVEELILLVNETTLTRKIKQPFLATLKNSLAAYDRGNYEAGDNMLHAFQNKVRAQIGSDQPDVAAEFIRVAQSIMDATSQIAPE